MPKVIHKNNPLKDENHILIFDGILSGNQVESELAAEVFDKLKSKNLNPIIFTGNDTVNFEKMDGAIFIKDNENLLNKIKNKKITYCDIKNEEELEIYISSLA